MEYMEQQMQQQIEAGISNAERCYARITDLEEQNAALAAMHVDNVRHIWESRNCGSCEELAEKHDALNATVAALRKFIESGSPINTNPDKCERRKLLAATPQHHLRQVRAEAGRDGFIAGYMLCNDDSPLIKHNYEGFANQYHASSLAGKE